MKRYVLSSNGLGVFDREKGIFISFRDETSDLEEYRNWLSEGNEPDSSFTLEEIQWEIIRSRRDKLLSETDYYLLPDWLEKLTEEQIDELKQYRQALRDIPQNFENPFDVVFPDKPNWLK